MADRTAEFGLRKTFEGNVHPGHISLVVGLFGLAFVFRACVSIGMHIDTVRGVGKLGFGTTIPSAKLKAVLHKSMFIKATDQTLLSDSNSKAMKSSDL